MSTYVMSDIHGNYKAYCAMLEKINFADTDILYVLGDVVDRGENGIKVLQDMMLRTNVIPILGNHEYMMLLSSKFLLRQITEESVDEIEKDPEILQGLLEWMSVGGDKTIEEFSKLSQEGREDVLDYLGEFTLYETTKVNGKEFILVHAGLCNFDCRRSLEDYRLDELLFQAPDYKKVYFENKFLITGHLPTRAIWADGKLAKGTACRDDIYIANNHIAIDCACGFPDGRLGCIRLEDFREYYV